MRSLIIILILLILIGCNDNDNESNPGYQGALYIADADGSNKQKVIDVGEVDYDEYDEVDINYVKFIYTKNKLVYGIDDLINDVVILYIVNIDGTDNKKISSEIEIKGTNLGYSPVSVSTDGNLIIFTGFINDQADLFIYEVDNETITNLTETNDVNEVNPRFSTDNESACFITTDDSLHYLCELDLPTLSIDTLYTSYMRIPGCIYSTDGEQIYFIEEFDDSNRGVSPNRDYYKCYLKALVLDSFEILILDDYAANLDSYIMDINDNYLLYRCFSSNEWSAYDLENYITIFIELYAGFIELNNNNQVLHSGDAVTGTIKLFNVETETSEIILDDSFGGSYNNDETKICYVGRYRVNKSRITK